MNRSSLYEHDFYAWTQRQAQLLREGKLAEVDTDHLIEEVESMGASERNQLQSRLRVLLAHLLKWQYQSHLRSRSGSATIKEQRLTLLDVLEENQSLNSLVEQRIAKAYPLAVLLAVRETNLEEVTFPADCPHSREQILDKDYYPD